MVSYSLLSWVRSECQHSNHVQTSNTYLASVAFQKCHWANIVDFVHGPSQKDLKVFSLSQSVPSDHSSHLPLFQTFQSTFLSCDLSFSMPGQLSKPIPPTRFPGICDCLVETGLYLGDMSFQDNVHWVRDGRADRLAIKPAEPQGKVGQRLPSPPLDDAPFNLAPISAVVQIDNNDYWLTVDANYRAPTEICPDYALIKPSCTVHMPDVTPFTADWVNVVDNLRWVQDSIATPKFTMKQGFFIPAGGCGPQFKLRHILFEVFLNIQF